MRAQQGREEKAMAVMVMVAMADEEEEVGMEGVEAMDDEAVAMVGDGRRMYDMWHD